MSKFIVLENVIPDPSVEFTVVSLEPPVYRLANLIGLWQPSKALITSGVLTSVQRTVGVSDLVNSSDASAPVIFASGTKLFFRNETVDKRLIVGTRPAGVVLPGLSAAGLSFAFAFKLDGIPTDDSNKGFIGVGGYSIRITTGGLLQFRYGNSNISATYTLPNPTSFHTLIVKVDVATTNLVVYIDGTKMIDLTSSLIVSPLTSTTAFSWLSSSNTSGRSVIGNYSELFIYNAFITTSDALDLHTYLNAKYAI